MKQLYLSVMVFVMVPALLSGVVPIPRKADPIVIVNNSNAPISVSWQGSMKVTNSSGIIAAGATGSLPLVPSKEGSMGSLQNQLINILITYYQADGVTPLDPVSLAFSPKVLAKSLYVYGDSATAITALTQADSSGNQYPARYAAWWSGDIDTKQDKNVAAAVADTSIPGTLVTLYMISVDGKNTLLTF